MRAAFIAILGLGAALLGLSPSESRADFRVCNETGVQVKLAFGHADTRFGWTSRGWWQVPAGSCQMVLYGDIPRGNYYVYTIDSANRAITVPEAQTGGTFCLKDDNFDLRSSGFMTEQNTIACEAHGLKGVKFRVIEVVDGAPTYTYALAPSATGVSPATPVVKEAAQKLERPTHPATTIAVTPAPSVQNPVARPPAPAGTACQRYPNLC